MAAAIGKYAANRYLKKQMKGYENKKVESGDDPYFAMVEDKRRPGKFKKVKKQIPDYIPEEDAAILASVRQTAYRLDMCLFNLFGIRFGWEAVIGLVPFAGDAFGVAMAMLLYKKACKVDGGLPQSLQTRMMINIILDFVVGLVPFVGDLADAAFKCNTKNLRLLEQHLDKKYKPDHLRRDERHFTGDRAKRASNRKSGIFEFNDPPPATIFEDSDDEAPAHAPTADVQRPQAALATEQERGRGGWFSGKKSSTRRDQENRAPMAQRPR